jgi:hypothetical protein
MTPTSRDIEAQSVSSPLRDASEPPVREGFECASCGHYNLTAVAGLFASRRAGSPQRFCDPSCRQAAYRRRRAGVLEDTPLQHAGGRKRRLNAPAAQPPGRAPTDPETARSRKGEAV